jgi:hypothetical protein
LLTQDDQLTPGIQAMQRFNTYTDAGLPPMAAAQIIGGQLFDVGAVPATRCAMAIAPNSPLLQDAITFGEEFGKLVDEDRKQSSMGALKVR